MRIAEIRKAIEEKRRKLEERLEGVDEDLLVGMPTVAGALESGLCLRLFFRYKRHRGWQFIDAGMLMRDAMIRPDVSVIKV